MKCHWTVSGVWIISYGKPHLNLLGIWEMRQKPHWLSLISASLGWKRVHVVNNNWLTVPQPPPPSKKIQLLGYPPSEPSSPTWGPCPQLSFWTLLDSTAAVPAGPQNSPQQQRTVLLVHLCQLAPAAVTRTANVKEQQEQPASSKCFKDSTVQHWDNNVLLPSSSAKDPPAPFPKKTGIVELGLNSRVA